MRVLYHLWLSPVCRKARIALAEKAIPFEPRVEPVWDRRAAFLALNPAGDVPVLVEEDGAVVVGDEAICAYIDETQPDPPLFGDLPLERAEVRRLVAWFDRKFNDEVTEPLVGEKVSKRFLGLGAPDSAAIRAGKMNIRHHLDYIGFLFERRAWLAGDRISLADMAAAAHISCVDYLGDVPWDDHAGARDWYARVKSRPSFRTLLADHIPGLAPADAYANLDF